MNTVKEGVLPFHLQVCILYLPKIITRFTVSEIPINPKTSKLAIGLTSCGAQRWLNVFFLFLTFFRHIAFIFCQSYSMNWTRSTILIIFQENKMKEKIINKKEKEKTQHTTIDTRRWVWCISIHEKVGLFLFCNISGILYTELYHLGIKDGGSFKKSTFVYEVFCY